MKVSSGCSHPFYARWLKFFLPCERSCWSFCCNTKRTNQPISLGFLWKRPDEMSRRPATPFFLPYRSHRSFGPMSI
jgi:hypothetical protein